MLFGTGSGPRAGVRTISPEQFDLVIKTGGHLPLADVLRCRVRYFADGAVLGGRTFVAAHLARYRAKTGMRHERDVHPIPPITDWGEMIALRSMRGNPFG
jgi:hypothetical protein